MLYYVYCRQVARIVQYFVSHRKHAQVYCTVSVVVAADGRTTFCILLRSHPLQSLRAPHRWRSVGRRTQAANGSRHQTSVPVWHGRTYVLVVMLPGKAAEIVVVLSLEGSSRKVGHLSATASAWTMDLSRRNWRVDLWWWSGGKLEC